MCYCYCFVFIILASLLHFFASSFVTLALLFFHSQHSISSALLVCPFIIWFCLVGCQIFVVVVVGVARSFTRPLYSLPLSMWWSSFFYICLNNLKSNFVVALPCLKIIKNVLCVSVWFGLISPLILPCACVFVRACVCVFIIFVYSLYSTLLFSL